VQGRYNKQGNRLRSPTPTHIALMDRLTHQAFVDERTVDNRWVRRFV